MPRPPRPSEVLGSLAALLAKNDINPQDIGHITKVKVGEYGKPEDPMITTQVIFSPKWAEGPKWPVVQPARPLSVRKASGRPRAGKGYRTAVVLPDPQIGYRRLPDGSLDPFQDEKAMKVALEMVSYLDPSHIIHAGDLLDLAEFSKYVKEPSFSQTTQAAVDRAHRWLAETIEAAPNATHDLLEGNHDIRLPNYILQNAQASFGLRRANTPTEWPVMTVPHLLRLDELGVTYHGGFPNGRVWINDNLCVVHRPPKMKSTSGASALASLDDERVSVIFGDVHRIELAHKTRNVRDGYKANLMASPGCLCRIDGTVPSTRGSIDPHGAPMFNAENWQNGIAVVRYKPNNGPFQVDLVPIWDGKAVLWGNPFSA